MAKTMWSGPPTPQVRTVLKITFETLAHLFSFRISASHMHVVPEHRTRARELTPAWSDLIRSAEYAAALQWLNLLPLVPHLHVHRPFSDLGGQYQPARLHTQPAMLTSAVTGLPEQQTCPKWCCGG